MSKRQRRPGATLITPMEAAQAIYVDYESSKERTPTLLGYLVAGEERAGIIEQDFAVCAEHRGCRHAVVEDHAALVERLVMRAGQEERVIVSWSEFDYDHLWRALDGHGELQAALQRVYRNARYSAARWRRRRYPAIQTPHTLESYLRRVRFPVPPQFGRGVVGDSLRRVRDQLTAGRDWPAMTSGARQAWRVVVKHNASDLRGMERVACFVAAKMAKATRATGQRERERTASRG